MGLLFILWALWPLRALRFGHSASGTPLRALRFGHSASGITASMSSFALPLLDRLLSDLRPLRTLRLLGHFDWGTPLGALRLGHSA